MNSLLISRGLVTKVGDNKTNEHENEEESEKENQGEEEEITLSKALKMADKLKIYCLRKEIPNVHSQVG